MEKKKSDYYKADTLTINTKFSRLNRYTIKRKLKTINICGEDGAIINGHSFHDVVDIAYYALDNLLLSGGFIMIRLPVYDFDDSSLPPWPDKLPNMLRKFIDMDIIEFIAQCINENVTEEYCVLPFIKTMLIGITTQKVKNLLGKVRFVSMPDKLIIDNSQEHPFYKWIYKGVPFTREECLSYEIYNEIQTDDIIEMYPYVYLSGNKSKYDKDSVELGEFMTLSPNFFPEKVEFEIDHLRHYFGKGLFDSYTDFVYQLNMEAIEKQKPYKFWRVVNDDAIVFKNESPEMVESLLILNSKPILVSDHNTSKEYKVAIQVKPEWKEKVDIEYIYLETRKLDFLKQFYFYFNLFPPVTLKSSTILKAQIAIPPSIDVQREIVRKEKEKYFENQRKALKSHEEALGINKGDISHSIGRPMDDIKILTKYLYDFFQSLESPISIDTVIQECKEPPSYSIKIALDEINQHIKKAEDWISGLGPDIKKPLLKLNIYSLLTKYFQKYSLRDYKFLIRYNLSGLEETFVQTNDNLGLILENFFSNAKRHAFRESSKRNMVDIMWGYVRFNNGNYLNISISNNGTPMEISLKEFIAYRTKGESSGNTGIGGNEIYQIIKSYNGYLGLKKGAPDFLVTFDILLPIDQEFTIIKTVKDYEPGEIE